MGSIGWEPSTVAKRYIPPPLMSHAERRKIIEAPFCCQIIGRKSSGGTSTQIKNAHYYPNAGDGNDSVYGDNNDG